MSLVLIYQGIVEKRKLSTVREFCPFLFNRTLELEHKCDATKVKFKKIETDLTDKFDLKNSIPVGRVSVDKISFKLNLLNLYPLLPQVEIFKTDCGLKCLIYYDLRAKFLQKYWLFWPIFIMVLFSCIFLRDLLYTGETKNETIIAFVGGNFLAASMLVFFVYYRERLWRKSHAKAAFFLNSLGKLT